MKALKNCLYLLCLVGLTFACQPDLSPMEQYEQRVEKELASGERNDSIFLGMYLGMESQAFFDHCWEMNRKGLFMDGLGNTAVAYQLKELSQKGQMYFFPRFSDEGKIKLMDVEFAYDSWSPWNKEAYADKLIFDVLRVYEDWYGKDFIKISDPKIGTVFTKVDGNRRISIWVKDERVVRASFVDLSIDPDAELLM